MCRAFLCQKAGRWCLPLSVLGVFFCLSSVSAQQFWKTDGTNATINTANYATTALGPFTSPFQQNVQINYTTHSLVTGATTQIGDVVLSDGITVAFTSGGTLGTGAQVRTLTIGTGAVLDLSNQNISTTVGTGFVKNGNGIVYLSPTNAGLRSGFTLNAGIVIVGNVNALGSGDQNSLTINGGTLAADGNTDLSGRYVNGITIGGNFTFGGTTTGVGSGNAVSNANLTFSNAVNLGSGIRTINLGGTGTYTLGGVISGTGG